MPPAALPFPANRRGYRRTPGRCRGKISPRNGRDVGVHGHPGAGVGRLRSFLPDLLAVGAHGEDPFQRADLPLALLQAPCQLHDADPQEKEDGERHGEGYGVRCDRTKFAAPDRLFERGVREGDADPAADLPHLGPLLLVALQARGFGRKRLHVAENPISRGTRQRVFENAALLEPLQGFPLPFVRGVAGAQHLQAGDVDGVRLLGEDLPHEPGHVGRVDQGQLTAVGGPHVAVRDGQIRVRPDRFADGDVHPAVQGDPRPGRDDRPEEDFPRRHGQPVPVFPDLLEILLQRQRGPDGEQGAHKDEEVPDAPGLFPPVLCQIHSHSCFIGRSVWIDQRFFAGPGRPSRFRRWIFG